MFLERRSGHGRGCRGKRGGGRMNAALLSSKNMCWCTPQDFFDKLNAEFGFVLDPAATDKTAKCSLYYTPETDGLFAKLGSRRRGILQSALRTRDRQVGSKKAFEEARGGYPIVLLIPARTDTAYFHDYIYGKRKSASCAGGYGSRTTTGTPPIPRPSLQW